MKIDRVRAYLVNAGNTNRLFVRVDTDDGLHGWGEAFARNERDETVERHVRRMGRHLLGRSPFNIKHFTEVMYLDYGGARGGFDFSAALSGIEIALWDIVGKACGQPIYNLLGGACRPRLRLYANGWANGNDRPEAAAERACAAVERGFTALKWDPFPGAWRAYIDKDVMKAAIGQVHAVREAVGPGIDLLIEVHRRLAVVHALEFGRAIEDFHPFWYEEPTTTENLDALADVRRKVQMPIVAGEALYTKWEFRQVFEKQAAEIINPDPTTCGGILALKEIASMAEPYGVAVSPHGYNVGVGFAATVQTSAVMPNFIITDFYLPAEALCREILTVPFEPKASYVELPTGPGLGIDLDEDALARHPYVELTENRIRTYEDETS